jgi:hypothetical protein
VALTSWRGGVEAAPEAVRAPAAAASTGDGFLLRGVPEARGCTPPRRLAQRRAPRTIGAALSVLRLPRTSIDGLPVLDRPDGRSSEDTGWLGGPLYAGCWTLAEIDRGRALGLVGRDRARVLIGLVPGGTTDTLTSDGGTRFALRSVDGIVYQPTRVSPGAHVLAATRR